MPVVRPRQQKTKAQLKPDCEKDIELTDLYIKTGGLKCQVKLRILEVRKNELLVGADQDRLFPG